MYIIYICKNKVSCVELLEEFTYVILASKRGSVNRVLLIKL